MTTQDRQPLGRQDTTYYLLPRRRMPLLVRAVMVLAFMFGTGYAAYSMFIHSGLDAAIPKATDETLRADAFTAPKPDNLPDRPINVLILGSDDRGDGSGRSDTMILLRLDFKRQFISQLSFPRDLYVEIPGHGMNKMNAAYSLGKTPLTIQTINQLIGEKVTYFFKVNFDGFRKLVDRSGGIYLDIDRYYFNDNTGRGERYEPINVKPGYYKLSGFEALDYVRFRHTDSDFSRIARQQNFLTEMKRMNRSVKGINNIYDLVREDVQTNVRSGARLKDFIEFGMGIEKDRVGKFQVPVAGGDLVPGVGSVVLLDRERLPALLDDWKNPTFQSDKNTVVRPSNPASLKVVVYNGSGIVGMAGQVGKGLEAKGYNILIGNNAPDGSYPSSTVYYAPGKRNDALALKAWFGPNASVGERRPEMTRDGDLIVVVGSDFTGLKKPAPATARARGAAAPKPDIVATQALKSRIVTFRAETGSDYLVPTHLPAGSKVVYVRKYSTRTRDKGTPNAIVIVLRLAGSSRLGGGFRYATIMQTTMKNPPIIKTATGQKGGFWTFYDGKTMQRLLWRRGDVTYWITNSLDGSLSDVTMRDMAKYMVRPGLVTKRIGAGTAVSVSDESRTP